MIDGGVFCGSRHLEYTLGPSGNHQRCTIPLATRTTARQSPCYSARPQYANIDGTSAPPSHSQLATIPECWQASCLGEDVLPYVQEALVDIAAWAACNNDGTQYADCFPAPVTCTHIDCSRPCPPASSTPATPPCTDCPHDPPHAQSAHLPTCLEAELAHQYLGGDYTLPALQGVAAPCTPAPRKHRRAAARAAVGQTHVEFTTGVNSRGYGTPRRKGKPLSKQLVRKELLASSHTKIALVGPDYVGCTTIL